MPMNPTPGESRLTGMVSVELGGLKFERQLSEKEAEFCKDVVETASGQQRGFPFVLEIQ